MQELTSSQMTCAWSPRPADSPSSSDGRGRPSLTLLIRVVGSVLVAKFLQLFGQIIDRMD
jgi:hypothetical protein